MSRGFDSSGSHDDLMLERGDFLFFFTGFLREKRGEKNGCSEDHTGGFFYHFSFS
ncbi:hypothetical protein ES703_44757 [subsurface metagenome]